MQSPWTKQIELGKHWVGCSAGRQDCSHNSIKKQLLYQTKIKPFREWKGGNYAKFQVGIKSDTYRASALVPKLHLNGKNKTE